MTMGTTLWGGRFDRSSDARIRAFGDSFSFDRRLAPYDVKGSIAYASSLLDVGVLSREEHGAIVSGLEAIAAEFATRSFESSPDDEDVHTAVERRLTELIGGTAGKLHTGRSRNDQVATDLRLYVLDAIDGAATAIRAVQTSLVTKAEEHRDAIMPGYTHMQAAQPILFSHWLLSFFWKLERDRGRLRDLRARTAVCPLGSGALSGNPFPIDRDALAAGLGFDAASENSLDAVEDRDFVAEFLSVAALLQTHLSSLAETLILWAGERYDFVRLDEAHCTGSSLMPQKRNPDALELIRGKTGRVHGRLCGFLTTLKGLPSGYNKDLQEDKEGLFDVVDTLEAELPIVADVVSRLEVNADRMASACDDSMLATELADDLVNRGIPFREAHRIVGIVVRTAESAGCALGALPVVTYRGIHPAFGEDVHSVLDVRRAIERRAAKGGTAPEAVDRQIEAAQSLLGDAEDETGDGMSDG